MDPFPFHPELFDARGRALEALGEREILWFSDFRSVDIEHEDYGLEVCGIRDRDTALQVAAVLRETFPDWRYGFVHERELWMGDPGWQVVICRRPRYGSLGDRDASSPAVGDEEGSEEDLALLRALLEDEDDDDVGGEDETQAESAGADPLEVGLRLEAIGDAARHAGDDGTALEAYREAARLAESGPPPSTHPGHRYRLALLSVKIFSVAERSGRAQTARVHRCRARVGFRMLFGTSGAPKGLEERRSEAVLDGETGLPNRPGLRHLLGLCMGPSAEPGAWTLLALLQTAPASSTEDSKGPEAESDDLARRLLGHFYGTGVVARWDATTLALVLRGVGDAGLEGARDLLRRAEITLTRARPTSNRPGHALPWVMDVGTAGTRLPGGGPDRLSLAAAENLDEVRRARRRGG